MKAYFTASISGKDEYESNYKAIFSTLEKMNVEMLSDHILVTKTGDVDQITLEREVEFYRKLNHWLNQADVVVAEVSHSSTSVGHEITLALSKNKPVIAMCVKEKKPLIFRGIKSERFQLLEYDIDDFENQLAEALEIASEVQDTRFNFFISPRLQSYLDWIAKNRQIPRSVFLRRLIEEHMRKNKDFHQD